MQRLTYIVCLTVFGWIGWWLGNKLGIGTAFVLSSIGTFFGVWVGYRINRDYLG